MPSHSEVVLRIRKTKTIQFGQKIVMVPYVEGPLGSPICPVASVISQIRSSPFKPNLPFFTFYKNSTLRWWSHSTFTDRLKKVLSEAGYDAKLYSCHSFRRGGASFGFELGMSLIEIKQRGDWASNAVEDYIFVSRDHIYNVAQRLSVGANQVVKQKLW